MISFVFYLLYHDISGIIHELRIPSKRTISFPVQMEPSNMCAIEINMYSPQKCLAHSPTRMGMVQDCSANMDLLCGSFGTLWAIDTWEWSHEIEDVPTLKGKWINLENQHKQR